VATIHRTIIAIRLLFISVHLIAGTYVRFYVVVPYKPYKLLIYHKILAKKFGNKCKNFVPSI
jgi:hypothetical protein